MSLFREGEEFERIVTHFSDTTNPRPLFWYVFHWIHFDLSDYSDISVRLDADSIFAMAADIGLDTERLQADMRDPQVIHYLEQMRLLADELDVTGTPAFVIGDAILLGGTRVNELKAVLDQQRSRSHQSSGG